MSMFGLGSFIEKFVDRKAEPAKEWQIGDGWGNDDIGDLTDEDEKTPEKEPQGVAASARAG